MFDTVTTLEMLEATSGRLAKESILNAAHDDVLLRDVLIATFDPYTSYGIKKWNARSAPGSVDDLGSFVYSLLPKLSSRFYTGNVATREVNAALATLTLRARKWAERILRRNLRIGVQVKTVNKTWPGSIVPFECQLAEKVNARTVNGEFVITMKLNYPLRCDPKLDGLRLIAMKSGGVVTLSTRNGTEVTTLPGLVALLESIDADEFVIDGECMGADWNESDSVIMSTKNKKSTSTMTYNVFDVVPFAEWRARRSTQPYSTRLEALERLISDDHIKSSTLFNIKFVPGEVINSDDELYRMYVRCLDEGHEGVMVKDLSATYTFGRSEAIMKLKPTETHEGVVTGWYDGRPGTAREGRLGGLIVTLSNGVATRVGSGFTDALLDEIASADDKWLGRVVECEAQPPLTPDGKMRFPRYKRTRSIDDVDVALQDVLSSVMK